MSFSTRRSHVAAALTQRVARVPRSRVVAQFLKAAAEIGVTQGAVSRQIQALEETLGTALFDRSPRGVSLTEQGDALLEYTIRIFSDVDELAARIGRPRSRQFFEWPSQGHTRHVSWRIG